MKKNKFRFLFLTLVVFACAISVSAQETESKSTRQSSIKKTVSQPRANQLFQPTQIAQPKYDLFKTPYLDRTQKGLQLFAFEMQQPILALQGEQLEYPIDWGCYLACRELLDLHPLVCAALCSLN